uniref:Pseudouridine synthase n=1 Tax=candidate division WOR-3 bacterium TaxID=2052148 RepID=A0A7C3UUL1_UNCW3
MEREFQRIVAEKMRGTRLDHYLLVSGIGLSRNKVVRLIREGKVLVNERKVKPSYRVKGGDNVYARFELERELTIIPEAIPLNIVYEDEDVIVIDKPKGMVVHPARGHKSGTLVNALLFHCQNLPVGQEKVRPGVIHRLDKDTTGLIVFAKTDSALSFLGKELEKRRINREYLAVLWGNLPLEKGIIEAPIGRDSLDRKKMAVTPFGSKKAITEFTVIKRYGIATYCRLKLLTGRTHQIRVHMSHYGHPVVGDKEYGRSLTHLVKSKEEYARAKKMLSVIDRQALHAARLGFTHPKTKEYVEFSSPLPEDMKKLLAILDEK